MVVRDLTEEEMVTLAITENIQREDLTPLEEGKIYLLMSDEMGYTHEQIAREVGRKRGYIENRIRVARSPKDVQELIQAKPDSIRAVATLIKVKDPAERAEIINMMLAGTLTVEDLPGYHRIQVGRPNPDETVMPNGRERPQSALRLAARRRTFATHSNAVRNHRQAMNDRKRDQDRQRQAGSGVALPEHVPGRDVRQTKRLGAGAGQPRQYQGDRGRSLRAVCGIEGGVQGNVRLPGTGISQAPKSVLIESSREKRSEKERRRCTITKITAAKTNKKPDCWHNQVSMVFVATGALGGGLVAMISCGRDIVAWHEPSCQ